MRLRAVTAVAGALFVCLAAPAAAQERSLQEVQAERIIPDLPVAEEPAAEDAQPETGLEILRRAESEYALTGDDIKEMAVGSTEAEGMAASDKIVISTTTVIIVLLVLILIT